MRNKAIVACVLGLALLVIGCDDERLARYAQKSVEQQAQQNQRLAAQHEEIAKATRVLVDAEARSRADFGQLARELDAERRANTVQRDSLETERREIAKHRSRDPVIAQEVANLSLLIVCGLPLLVCIYILLAVTHRRQDDKALNELLIDELTSSAAHDDASSNNDMPSRAA